VSPDGFEVGVFARQAAVVRVQADGPPEVVEGLVGPPAHPERHGHDVVCVIALRVFTERTLEMIQCAGVVPRVERDGGGINAFRRSFGSCRLPGSFALADAEIEPRSLE
jgi:hypothetical protein